MIPAAVLAVIRATLEDAPTRELLNRPGWTAQRVTRDLEQAGWTIIPTPPRNAAQRPA
ncbi:hypothetical protein [Streptomyces similanensis]|uniref:Transposase n=1 Tax=Streptomyces similanensis TaxID=1274988 RepID=A0ABP9KD16_9ACTN